MTVIRFSCIAAVTNTNVKINEPIMDGRENIWDSILFYQGLSRMPSCHRAITYKRDTLYQVYCTLKDTGCQDRYRMYPKRLCSNKKMTTDTISHYYTTKKYRITHVV